jgi:hypothetical protein
MLALRWQLVVGGAAAQRYRASYQGWIWSRGFD